jgi:hypothetical protein
MASGPVQNGSFKLFTGTQGTPGAIPGKYKVVLVAAAGAAPTASMYQQAAAGASRSSPAPTAALPFPDKYKDAATSDEEVEITSGSNTLKIEIP